MRYLQDTARVVLALWLALALAPVKAWAGNPMLLGAGGAGAAPIVFSLAWTGSSSQESSGGTTVNYASQSLGAADPNRVIAIVACTRSNGGAPSISSATIDGISATLAPSSSAAVASDGVCAIYYAADATANTTATISVTYNAATLRTAISVYRIITGTPAPSAGANNGGSGQNYPTSVTISIPAGGSVLAGGYAVFSSGAMTWSNATSDTQLNASSSFSTARATGSNPGISGPTGIGLMSAAAWGP